MNHLIDPAILASIRCLRTCEHAYLVVSERPTAYPYQAGTLPAATKRRKLAKLRSDMRMALATLVPSVAS
jgi:hypothetical protein